MKKNRFFVQLIASLLIVVVFGIVIMLTFSSLLKKSKFLLVEETMKNATLSVLLYEGLEEEFSGYLVYYANSDDNGKDNFTDIVAYTKINEKSATLIADQEVKLNISYEENSSFMNQLTDYRLVAGQGATKIIDAALHDSLLSMQVLYYRHVDSQ